MSEVEKFEKIYNEIDKLISAEVDCDSPSFKAWHMKAGQFLCNKFGAESLEYEHFINTEFSPFSVSSYTRPDEFVSTCKDDLIVTKEVFSGYLEEMRQQVHAAEAGNDMHEKAFSKLFVVYGHNGELTEKIARVLDHQGITPIILSKMVRGGKTIIEQLEDYSSVPAAVCLFTADDLGKEKNEEKMQNRARQNVVFETGLLMGKLGRGNVIIVVDEAVEMPSDLKGIHYINKDDWKVSFLQELKGIGYNVDANKLF